MKIISKKYLRVSILALSTLTFAPFVFADPDSDSDDSDRMSVTSSRHVPSSQQTYLTDEICSDEEVLSSSGGSKVWNKPGIPHTGWSHVGVERLPEANGVCEMCDQTHIRFMHEVSHPTHPNLHVGITCADNMTSLDRKSLSKAERATKKAYEQRQREIARREHARQQQELRAQEEQALRQRYALERARTEELRKQQHRQRWITLESWNVSERGNYVNSVKPGQRITIFKKGGAWGYVSNETFSTKRFNTPQEAAEQAYVQWFK